MNILVTGANGQLGNEMRRVSKETPHNWFFTDVEELDITRADAVEEAFAKWNIDAVVNCAAFTDVERAEQQEELAMLLNAEAPAILARAARRHGALIIHISTDYVFGGNLNNIPCREDQTPNPTGVYGRSKLLGEKSVAENAPRHLIFRTAWLYSEFGRNFLKTMLRLTGEKEALNVVFDQVGTPTYALGLAKAIVKVLDTPDLEGKYGIYHYSDEGVCSWFDFTKAIAALSGQDSCRISPCHSDEFPSSVVRPPYSVLDKSKVKSTFGVSVPYWIDSLKECLNNIQSRKA